MKSHLQKQQKLCPSKICMYTLQECDIVQGKVLASLTNSAQFTDKFRYMYSDNQRPTKTLHAICFIGNNLSKFHPPYNPLYNICDRI